MEVSNECYMLMEREKLSKDGNYKYAGIDEFTGLIMEESVEGTIMSKLKSYNIDIYC
jgi:DeoR/GlpR family transcriptional regulator of sugar metabolism